MKFKITPEEEAWLLLKGVAAKYHISPLRLWDIYCVVMERNFEKDINKIAKENKL